jgi:hypothetical protein
MRSSLFSDMLGILLYKSFVDKNCSMKDEQFNKLVKNPLLFTGSFDSALDQKIIKKIEQYINKEKIIEMKYRDYFLLVKEIFKSLDCKVWSLFQKEEEQLTYSENRVRAKSLNATYPIFYDEIEEIVKNVNTLSIKWIDFIDHEYRLDSDDNDLDIKNASNTKNIFSVIEKIEVVGGVFKKTELN